MFTGKGFSSEPLTEEELRIQREAQKHYIENIAPHAKWISAFGLLKSYILWAVFAAAAATVWAAKSGLLFNAST